MSFEAVAMSGGVDSSVAALLRVRAGARVVGLTMKLWDPSCDDSGDSRPCCNADHAADALRVCQKLSVPHYVLDLREEFRRDVVDLFVSEYLAGRTPNPCVACNTHVKWDVLHERARELGCTTLVTGHYARIEDRPDGPALLRGRDLVKDQSYFLWGIPRNALATTVFPLGDMDKPRIREIAAADALPTATKSESQDICFVPGGDYRALIRSAAPQAPLLKPGPIVGPGGKPLGTHQGLASYTLGQRRGIQVAWTEPLYVVGMDLETNTLRLGPQDELMVDRLVLGSENWLVDGADSFEGLSVQIRYRSAPLPCHVVRENDRSVVILDSPAVAPAPGQSMVVYQGDRVLGGGILWETGRSV